MKRSADHTRQAQLL